MAKKLSGGSGDSKDPTISYEVGYGRPPIESRFQPGQSGNPKGRQKRKHDCDADQCHDEGRSEGFAARFLSIISGAVGLADEAPDANSHQPLTVFDDALVADFLRRNSPNGSDEPSDGGKS